MGFSDLPIHKREFPDSLPELSQAKKVKLGSREIKRVMSHEELPPSKKPQLAFDNLLALQEIASLPQDTFQKEISHVSVVVHSFYLAVKDTRDELTAEHLLALQSVEEKLKLLEKAPEKVINEIEVLKLRVLFPQHMQKTATSGDISKFTFSCADLSKISREEFWLYVSVLLKNDPKISQIEIENVGSFQRQVIQNLIDLNLAISPLKLSRFLNVFEGAQIDSSMFTPLHTDAISGRQSRVAEYMTDIDVRDKRGFTALEWAAFLGEKTIVKQLLDNGASPTREENGAVYQAVVSGETEVLEMLLNSGVKVDMRDKEGSTQLLWAVNVGNLNAVKLLVKHGAHIDAGSKDGYTPLMCAASKGNTDIIEFLLEKGADVHVKDSFGWSPLLYAVDKGKLDAVKLLVKHGAHIDAGSKDGYTPLMCAAYKGNTDIIEYLFEKGADVHAKTSSGWSPLLYAVDKGKLDAVKLLVKHGAHIDAGDKDGYTPLMDAANKGNTDIMGYLLEKGADVLVKNSVGFTPLLYAISRGHLGAVKLLLDYGADVNVVSNEGDTPLQLLISLRPLHWKLMKDLIKTHALKNHIVYAKSYGQMKFLSHAFAIEGHALIQGKSIELEGYMREHNAHQMAKSLFQFASVCPHLLDKATATHLAQSLYFAADTASHTPQQILNRIQRGLPTILFGGFKEHATVALFWKLHFHCNRGAGYRRPIEVDQFDLSRLDVETLERQRKVVQTGSLEEYKQFQFDALPTKLDFKHTDNEKKLEELIQLPLQVVGNCSWASLEGIVKAFLVMSKIDDPSIPLTDEKAKEIKESVDITFATLVVFQQMKILEKYLEQEHDDLLVVRVFDSLRNAKSLNPQIFEHLPSMLESLEEKYASIAPFKPRLFMRIHKAWGSAIPFESTLEKTLDVIGALSSLCIR